MITHFDVAAISIRMVLNNFGDYDPNGQIYVLKDEKSIIEDLIRANPFTTVSKVQPLVIRVNEGEAFTITFWNYLSRPAGIHLQRADYDPNLSDGANVGDNQNTLASPQGSVTYTFQPLIEGTYLFTDLGSLSSSEELGSTIHGLFGAVIVEKRGSWWTDPVTGKPIKSGVYADVHNPLLPSFREYAWFFHDEQEVKDLTGNPPIDPMTGEEQLSIHGVNYRYEPLANRKKLIEEGVVCPECEGEEVHHDSWVFGDPTTPILKGYRGDPVKIRLIHGGIKETHVFHYHVHQWFSDPTNTNSIIIDSQSISPQTTYTIEPFYGLGSLQKSFGDVIVHCHLYPHFMAGMWGINRIFDTRQDGKNCYPNGVRIEALQPLPKHSNPFIPPDATVDKPGFPNFIPGKVGFKAPRPPLGIVGGRGLTRLERLAAIANPRPGAVFSNPAIGDPDVYEYNVSAIELPIVYNKEGWCDPTGRIFVLDEDKEAILCGEKTPEPLVIHTPAGALIRVNFTNCLPHVLDGNAFQLVTRTYEVGFHIHFVKFDVLVNDGANVGWNYDSSILPGQTIMYEYYADVELNSWFFHDHLFATSHQQHGLFGCGVIQPRFSTFLSSKTGKEVRSGTQISVTNPLISSYRDFTLFAQDFVLLFNQNREPIQPPDFPSSQDDPGIFAVNYRNEPLAYRYNKMKVKDPAYSFSSIVGGDPYTPLLEAYAGDSIRIHLLQGAQEESHSFNLYGLRWKAERPDVESRFNAQQHTGLSESFTLETYIPTSGDYLWTFENEDDLWLGCWGLIRGYGQKHDGLIPLNSFPKNHTEQLQPLQQLLQNVGLNHAPIRKYEVVAFQINVTHNQSYKQWVENSVIFALKEDYEKMIAGEITPIPLILRGNVGEVIQVTVENKLEFEKFPNKTGIYDYPDVPVQSIYVPSTRVSLNPQLLQYDVTTSSGGAFGRNKDGTVEAGSSITYYWYVDEMVGSCGLWDMADVRNHRSQGAFGMFIAESRFTTYHAPNDLRKLIHATEDQIVLKNPLLPTQREYALILHDGIRLLDKEGSVILDPADAVIGGKGGDMGDDYDQGSRGFNYRTERLNTRYQDTNKNPNKDQSILFNSTVYGDPATPVFLAYPGDPIVFRLVNPAQRRRAHSFMIHGHYFNADFRDITSQIVGSVGAISTGYTGNFYPYYGAGGYTKSVGDYLYRSGNIRWHLEAGVWGIFRVLKQVEHYLSELS